MSFNRNKSLFFYTAVFLFVISMLMGYLSQYYYICRRLSKIVFIMFLGCLLCSTIYVFLNSKELTIKTNGQLAIIYTVFAVFWTVAAAYSKPEVKSGKICMVGLIVLNFSMMYYLILFFSRISPDFVNIKKFVKQYIGVIIIMAVFAVLSCQNFGIWFKSDNHAYYSAVVRDRDQWDFTLNTLSAFEIGGHASYAYTILLLIGEYLMPARGNGIYFINILMSETTIFCFYKIIQKIFKNAGTVTVSLVTAVFTFAPLFLGISYLLNTDFPMLFFFVLFVCSYLYDMPLLRWVSGLGVCFSKEIGIGVLFGFFAGEYIYLCMQLTKRSLFTYVRQLIRLIPEYSFVFIFLVSAVLSNSHWVIILQKFFRGSSEREKTMGLNNAVSHSNYIIYKLEEVFILHFAWVMLVLLIMAIVKLAILLYRGKCDIRGSIYRCMHKSRYVWPLGMSAVSFAAMSLIFVTYVHYRYLQLAWFFYVPVLYALTVFICQNIKWQKIALTVCLVLFFMESYITIDPLSFLFFRDFNTGNGRIISTKRYFDDAVEGGRGFYEAPESILVEFDLHEGTANNRQELNLQYLMEDAFTRIDYDSSKLIVLDDFGGWLDNDCWELFGAPHFDGWYWDKELQTVTTDSTKEEVRIVGSYWEINFDDYSEIYYIKFPFNPYREDNFVDEHDVVRRIDVSKGVWSIVISQVK